MLKTRHMWKCGCDGISFSDIFCIFVEITYRPTLGAVCNFELLLCYVCAGYAGQGLTEDGVSRHQNKSGQHLMCDLVYTVWCTRFGLIHGYTNLMHGTFNMKIILSTYLH